MHSMVTVVFTRTCCNSKQHPKPTKRRKESWLLNEHGACDYSAVRDKPTNKTGDNPTQVFRSATEVAVTAYEPKRCETLRAVLPIRGARGISVWIQWEVEMATIRRKRELLRRLGEVQKVRRLIHTYPS